MRWLIGPVIGAAVASVLLTQALDEAAKATKTGVTSVARAGLWVSVWTAVFTASGMQGFTRWVRKLRQRNRDFGRRIGKGR